MAHNKPPFLTSSPTALPLPYMPITCFALSILSGRFQDERWHSSLAAEKAGWKKKRKKG